MDPLLTATRLHSCAILFVDLRGYTTLCEQTAPAEAAGLLDEFYHAMGSAVSDTGGRVHNLAGDSVMAVFGLGLTHRAEENARSALACGRRMISVFEAVGQRWEAQYQIGTGIGVGVHLGLVAEALLGPPSLRRGTLVGDAVNVAARLCHRARAGEVLFSAEVAAECADEPRPDVIALPNFSLRGRVAPVRIYCVPAPERPPFERTA